jgi:clan AA aspartic protease
MYPGARSRSSCPDASATFGLPRLDAIMNTTSLRMGLTFVKVTVGNPANGHRRADVSCLVDSGAVYSLIPGTVLRKLHIKPHSTREFILANGDVIKRRLATATFEYDGRRGDSLVIVGERGDDPLLGATTIEGFGLVLDPFRRELRPMTLPLKHVRRA